MIYALNIKTILLYIIILIIGRGNKWSNLLFEISFEWINETYFE